MQPPHSSSRSLRNHLLNRKKNSMESTKVVSSLGGSRNHLLNRRENLESLLKLMKDPIKSHKKNNLYVPKDVF